MLAPSEVPSFRILAHLRATSILLFITYHVINVNQFHYQMFVLIFTVSLESFRFSTLSMSCIANFIPHRPYTFQSSRRSFHYKLDINCEHLLMKLLIFTD